MISSTRPNTRDIHVLVISFLMNIASTRIEFVAYKVHVFWNFHILGFRLSRASLIRELLVEQDTSHNTVFV